MRIPQHIARVSYLAEIGCSPVSIVRQKDGGNGEQRKLSGVPLLMLCYNRFLRVPWNTVPLFSRIWLFSLLLGWTCTAQSRWHRIPAMYFHYQPELLHFLRKSNQSKQNIYSFPIHCTLQKWSHYTNIGKYQSQRNNNNILLLLLLLLIIIYTEREREREREKSGYENLCLNQWFAMDVKYGFLRERQEHKKVLAVEMDYLRRCVLKITRQNWKLWNRMMNRF